MALKKTVVLTGLALSLVALPALALDNSALELGKKLFNTPGLGGSTNGKSCNSCHPNGAKLEKAGASKDLLKNINRCILGPMAGKRLEWNSPELKALKLYVESLAKKK